MRVLVTGGAGFIGSHLVDKLIQKGLEVTVIDNFSSGKKDNVNMEARIIEGDLKDLDFVEENLRDFEIVYHFAANPDVRLGVKDRRIHLNENILATHNILESMVKNKINKIVFASTSAVYGEAKKMPTKESYGPLITSSLYGASKLSAESLIYSYSEFGIKSWIFRLANVVGGRSDHGVIPDFTKKLSKNPHKLEVLGDGNQTKSYLHVDDCVDAIIHAVENSNQKVNVFNIGSPDTIKVSQIAKEVINKKSPKAKIKYTGGEKGWKGDVPKFLLDITKIRSLGWSPKLNSRQSVIKTINEQN